MYGRAQAQCRGLSAMDDERQHVLAKIRVGVRCTLVFTRLRPARPSPLFES